MTAGMENAVFTLREQFVITPNSAYSDHLKYALSISGSDPVDHLMTLSH